MSATSPELLSELPDFDEEIHGQTPTAGDQHLSDEAGVESLQKLDGNAVIKLVFAAPHMRGVRLEDGDSTMTTARSS